MICYSCGFELTRRDVCPNCGAPVKAYKQAIAFSNYYYNRGLVQAKERDLTGAAASLRQCLKMNKNHLEARNLLGLVYCELGEVVDALTQWVISKNFSSGRSLADSYLNALTREPATLDQMGRAVITYNTALRACRKGNYDVALLQLKKAVQLNSNLLRARQLLALLYLRNEEWEKAQRELTRCMEIDAGSPRTLRYLQEVESRLSAEEVRARRKHAGAARDAVMLRHGNETIIQPVHRFRLGESSSMAGVLTGLVLGALAVGFLILPGRIQNAALAGNERIAAISEESDAKNEQLAAYERQIEELTAQAETLTDEVESFQNAGSDTSAMDALMRAVSRYMAGDADMQELSEYMAAVDPVYLDERNAPGYTALYRRMTEAIGPQIAAIYYEDGRSAYQIEDYDTAITKFALAWQYDETHLEALYNLAEAWYRKGDSDRAKRLYDEVTEKFPDSRLASDAKARIAEINNAEGDTDGTEAVTSGNGAGQDGGTGRNADTGQNDTAGQNAGTNQNGAAGQNPDTDQNGGTEGAPERTETEDADGAAAGGDAGTTETVIMGGDANIMGEDGIPIPDNAVG